MSYRLLRLLIALSSISHAFSWIGSRQPTRSLFYDSWTTNNHGPHSLLTATGTNEPSSQQVVAIKHVYLLDKSLRKLTGRGVCERMGYNYDESSSTTTYMDETYQNVCLNDRYVLVSHGIEQNPIYNYGNVACLDAFARSWEDHCKLPSAQSVVIRSVDEKMRIELMRKVTETGVCTGVEGIRVRGDGKFIKLVDAVVWNCYDDNDDYYGQAAFFDLAVAEILTDAYD